MLRSIAEKLRAGLGGTGARTARDRPKTVAAGVAGPIDANQLMLTVLAVSRSGAETVPSRSLNPGKSALAAEGKSVRFITVKHVAFHRSTVYATQVLRQSTGLEGSHASKIKNSLPSLRGLVRLVPGAHL